MATTAIEVQQGLNEVVMNKVQRMVENKAVGVQATMERLIEEGKIAQDYIAPLGVNLRKQEHDPVITFKAENGLFLNMPDGQFSVHSNAVRQLADRMGVPQRYLLNLAGGDEWAQQLAAHLLNEHSSWTQRSRVLIRTVGEQVRGVLSDSYRRLNSVEILTAFVQEAAGQGAVISDAYMNDTKVWAETILPTPITIPTAKNGDVIIFAGARFSTSDYGDGAVDMRAFLLNGACLNGMVRESVMKQVHLGSKLPDNLQLSQKTYELDTRTTVSAVRDLTRGLFSKDNIMQKAIEIQAASEIDVDFEREIKKLTKDGGLLKAEGQAVEKILMNNNPDDGVQGAATLWKLTQAITAHARELTPERSRELHEISGALMNRVRIQA
ncbi:MAG: hypothetical protein IKU22_08810 [Alistipes sp.]|nr:hypothetical protein [Alistipes sp.]